MIPSFTSRQESVEKIKGISKNEYDEHVKIYKGTNPKVRSANYNGLILKSHCDIYYGLYHRNKSIFDKGVDDYEKYSLLQLNRVMEASLNGEEIVHDLNIYKNDELVRQIGEQMKIHHHHYNVRIPKILDEYRYWDE
jgi:hypothetical protein